MGQRTAHLPGTFSWVELATSDPTGAKSFYGDLFGWEFEDSPIPEEAGGGVYTMCKVQGDSAAAISGQPPGDPSPPHWNNYVTVSSADETAARAKELGGVVLAGPFDVMTAGRMAVLADSGGAVCSIWEAGDSIGAERVNDLGCLTWNELHTGDIDRAVGFYSALFGWNTEDMDTQGGPRYVIVKVGDRTNGGIMNLQEGEPPNWLPYFVVADRDAACDRAKELGGNEFARLDMPQGRIAALQDPQGAAFAVWEGQTDD